MDTNTENMCLSIRTNVTKRNVIKTEEAENIKNADKRLEKGGRTPP